MSMIPVNITLSEQQKEAISNIIEKTGLSMSEIIRRAVDDYALKFNREQMEFGKKP